MLFGAILMCYLGQFLCVIWDNSYVLFGTILMCYLGQFLCVIWDNSYVLFGTSGIGF